MSLISINYGTVRSPVFLAGQFNALEWYKLIVQGAVLTGPALKVLSVKD